MGGPFVPDDEVLEALLRRVRTIAVVGLSDNPARPSHDVSRYMRAAGYRIVPINPKLSELWGERAYPDLVSARKAGVRIDLVDVFREPSHVPGVVDDAIAAKAPAIWLQEGVIHEEAARRAKDAGMIVVMDRCAKKEHARLVA